MNGETLNTVIPPPEPPAPSPGQPGRKPGLFRRWLGMWRDRDLDLEGRDTSSWNIYYYFYRQVAQHRSMFKLKYLKWFALLFQLYFFGTVLLALISPALDSMRRWGNTKQQIISHLTSSLLYLATPYIIPLIMIIPVFMVCSAFKLRSKSGLFMTSRAKEPPLLAHLVQYTSGEGLVEGALQSLFYTWGRFALLLLPAIVMSAVLLIIHLMDRGMFSALYVCFPLPLFLLALTFSIFLVMQGFCFRFDSLAVMIAILIEAGTFVFVVLLDQVFSGRTTWESVFSVEREFWFMLFGCFVPSCVFGCFYFPLAAIDTNAYGLGKRSSKQIRVLLFATAGVFLAMLFAGNVVDLSWFTSNHSRELDNIFYLFEVWGIFLCVFGLLVTSHSMTSHHAERLCRIRAGEPFLRQIFDPASPLSLIPIFLLEAVSVGTFLGSNTHFLRVAFSNSEDRLALCCAALLPWAVLHFGLLIEFTKQRFKQDMKPAWNSHIRFNLVCIILAVITLLSLLLFHRIFIGFSIVVYLVSIVLWGFIALIERQYSARNQYNSDTGRAPAWDRKGNAP